jgi:hypothetical protein
MDERIWDLLFRQPSRNQIKEKLKKVQFYYHKRINIPQFEHNLLTQA